MTPFVENHVEQAALFWLEGLGFSVISGPTIAPGEPSAERSSFGEVILKSRLREALVKLNPSLPSDALDEAFRKLITPPAAALIPNNVAFHRMLVNGVEVEYQRADGSIGGEPVKVIDFDNPTANDWLAVNQFAVTEDGHSRRPDIVLFVNGLPLAVLELKNAASESATITDAFHQLQTYKHQIPSLFHHNATLVISDGLHARIGTISANRERFMPWRTVEGETLAPAGLSQLEVLLKGVFDPTRFLDLIRYCMVFEDEGDGPVKKMAGYHQFHAVRVAAEETVRASQLPGTPMVREARGPFGNTPWGGATGDRRIGVVWHTQGSGKSLTMAFYAGRIILHPAMDNPTLVVLTDRNDLDGQLHATFSRCWELLRQKPVQAESRAQLRQLLTVASGGVVFTTIQKFFPEEKGDKHPLLSDRRNIVVIADEAHRSQYDFIDGYARHMRDALPNASFIGFTGTPIEQADANTRAVFGEHISVYDIQQAVLDGATVPIYYEGRLAKLALSDEEKPRLDEQFEEATEGEELERKEKLKTKWAALEALVGSEKRLTLIAKDLVAHWDLRLEAGMEGKALIVCMSRRICVDLYKQLVALRPEWHSTNDASGVLKIVMTGSASDPLEWQDHIRNGPRRKDLAKRFKDAADPLKIVIVRDMWLTGFDVPSLHTMYVDKPMRGHGLMQAIARVNRVFKDKPGGLVVDYLGLADELRHALATYTDSGGKGQTAIDQAEAVALMKAKYEVCCDLFHGFDRTRWLTGTPAERMTLIPTGQEHILAQENGKDRFVVAVGALSKTFALAVPHDDALAIRDDVAFFQAVRTALAKSSRSGATPQEDLDHAIRQIVSNAVAPGEVMDIFAAAGLKKPDISILSDEFLADVRGLPHRNLALEVLQKLLREEIKLRSKRHLVQARSFADMLEKAIRAYQSRAIETAQVIEELIRLAKDMREAERRGDELGLTPDESAFYEALEVNDSAVAVLGDEKLRIIARELLTSVKQNATIDWTLKQSVQAKLRTIVKRILRKYGYPPDKQEQATKTVLEQAELLADSWAA
ncbi:MAG TPA: type I restriction endonuclease subunit R [Vicinamibacterales bacterium]|nr:type I restriction endonuclease subunit R [Vicinamibacterales bacterium]